MSVGLAAITLVGVVGPLLVWRASRTSRNLAIARLDRATASSEGFVTNGVRFWRDVHLFRRVRAPELSTPPRLKKGWKPKWNPGTTLPSKSSAGWVQLSVAIRAYGFEYPGYGDLVYRDDRALLATSPIWLFILGLVGRFGQRIDTDGGRWLKKPRDGVSFRIAIPGKHLRSTAISDNEHLINLPNEAPIAALNWAPTQRFKTRAKDELRGLVGTVRPVHVHRMADNIFDYVAFETSEIGGLDAEPLDLSTLLWLALGCLPLSDGRVLHLGNVEYSKASPGTFYEDSETNFSPSSDVASVFDDEAQRYYPRNRSQPFIDASRERPRYYSDVRETRRQWTAQDDAWSDDSTDEATTSPVILRKPRIWSLTYSQERLVDFAEVSNALEAEQDTQKWLLTDSEATPTEVLALQEEIDHTYVPCHRPWVRLGNSRSSRTLFFLRRSDAQLLARALIQLPVCSQGYLFHQSRHAACRDFLVDGYHFLPRLLFFTINHIERFSKLQGGVPQELRRHLSTMYSMTKNYSYSRAFASTLYKLDCGISELISQDNNVHLFVQVLAVTSPEFRDIFSQSLRTIKECLSSSSSITFDAETTTIRVGTVMGAVRRFPIDVDVLVDKPRAFERIGELIIPYEDVLCLVLRACLRSTFLKTSLDSTPLCEGVLSSLETVEIAGI